MSEYRRQTLISAPIERVWELVGNPARHPEWFPRVVEVRGDSFQLGDIYVQVSKQPVGIATTTLEIDQVEEMRELSFHCRDTGMFSHWLLTPAREDTFVEAEFGMEPTSVVYRMFDATAGRMYFRRWLMQTMDALARQVSEPGP